MNVKINEKHLSIATLSLVSGAMHQGKVYQNGKNLETWGSDEFKASMKKTSEYRLDNFRKEVRAVYEIEKSMYEYLEPTTHKTMCQLFRDGIAEVVQKQDMG